MRKRKKSKIIDTSLLLTMSITFILVSVFIPLLIIISKNRDLENADNKEFADMLKYGEIIKFENGFYTREISDIKYRWSNGNATIKIAVPYDQFSNFKMIIWSYRTNRNVGLYIDNMLIDNIEINKSRKTYTSPLVYLSKGIHTIKLISDKPCEIPSLVENSSDNRCLAFGIGNFETSLFKPTINQVEYDGWYNIEDYNGSDMRWVSANSKIPIILTKGCELKLSFNSFPFGEGHKLIVLINDNPKIIKKIDNITQIIMKNYLNKGYYVIKLSCGYCTSPRRIGLSNDDRCLSCAIYDLKLYCENNN